MLINQIIKTLMKEEGFTQTQMAVAIGKELPNEISARLASKNMTFKSAVEMLSVLGYEVIVQKKSQGAKRKDQHIVTIDRES